MIFTNLENVPGHEIIEHYGLVAGSAVRAKFFGSDLLAGIKNFFGGELTQYTKLMNRTRKQALERMQQQAQSAGADAIINIRFATSTIARGASEVYVYGTAVRLKQKAVSTPQQEPKPTPEAKAQQDEPSQPKSD